MNVKLICPQCNTENLVSAIICINCGFNLSTISSRANKLPDWLINLRQSENEESKGLSSNGENLDYSSEENGNSFGESPDWLNRIKDIDQQEEGDKHLEKDHDEILHTSSSADISDFISSLRNQENFEVQNTDGHSVDDVYQSPSAQINPSIESEISDQESDNSTHPSPQNFEQIKSEWQVEFPFPLDMSNDENIPPAEEFPEWLKNNISGIDEETSAENSDIPGWLETDNDQTNHDSTKSGDSIDLPDWLSKSNFLVEEEVLDHTEPEKDEGLDKYPDWINEINKVKEDNIDKNSSSSQDSNQELVDSFSSVLLFNKLDLDSESIEFTDEKQDKSVDRKNAVETENGSQDNLKTEESAFILPDKELESLSVKPFIGIDENEEWLNSFSPLIDEKTEGENNLYNLDKFPEEKEPIEALPFKFGKMPDWLEDIDLEYKDLEPEKISDNEELNNPPGIESNLERANLPEWLKSIRPIEVVTPDTSKLRPQKIIEKSGPLAGLQGVLSSESVTQSYSPPPAYSVTINVTEKQRAHLKILEDIISPYEKIESTTINKKHTFQKIESFLIPIFLLLIVVYSLFLDYSNQTLPEVVSPDAIRFQSLISGYLNKNQEPGRVLVIFETDASSYPEIDLIAGGVFEDLFTNNHWVTSITSNPDGVILSQNILKKAHVKIPSYNFDERTTNLGYLPGNAIGIQSFLTNPQNTSYGNELTEKVWEKPPLNDIQTINDFDMLLLITDNSDHAKLWVEQINFFNSSIDLLVISSTKASPMLQPYLETNQIDGMLSGIQGGFAFDILSKTETYSIARYVAILQIIVVVFIFFILVGGVIAIFNKAFSLERPEKHK